MLALYINPPEVLAKLILSQIPNLDTNQDGMGFYSLHLLRLLFKGIVGDPSSEALDILGLQRDANFHHVLNALPESAPANGIILKVVHDAVGLLGHGCSGRAGSGSVGSGQEVLGFRLKPEGSGTVMADGNEHGPDNTLTGTTPAKGFRDRTALETSWVYPIITGAPPRSPQQLTSLGVSLTVAIRVRPVLLGPGCPRVTLLFGVGTISQCSKMTVLLPLYNLIKTTIFEGATT